MASLLSTSQSSLFFFSTYPKSPLPIPTSLSFPPKHSKIPKFPSLRLNSSPSDDATTGNDNPSRPPEKISDEWGEEAEPEPESSYTRFPDSDPPKGEDEWGSDGSSNGNAAVRVKDDKNLELKRCLIDTVYGTEFGFRAGVEERAEVLELVNQLEAANPTPAPVEATGILDGNWILVYTAFSELLPLLAIGTIPLVKVEKISQEINTNNLTIVNSTTLSSPFSTFSFSASASFEGRTPARIQVEFKEGILQPPEIKSKLDLPENLNIFGQKVNLSPVQQLLNPIQEAVANLFRAISGQPPLKIPIPGNRNASWLLTTYLDEDLRISRGDGGLFVLAKEGSPLLDQ